MKKIPLFLTLSQHIDFIAESYFPTQKATDIFKAFGKFMSSI